SGRRAAIPDDLYVLLTKFSHDRRIGTVRGVSPLRWLVFATVLPWALAACATTPHATVSLDTETLTPAEQAWRDTIVPSDQALIEDLPSIWTHVLTTAKKRSGKAIDAEGPLLQADAALDHPALPPGSYWCRVVRIGSIA